MAILNYPLTQKIIQAICWTLLNSLWQGMILAVIAGIVMMSTRKSKPVLRYNLLTILLFLFVPATFYTFWLELEPVFSSPDSSVLHVGRDLGILSINGGIAISATGGMPWIGQIIHFFDIHAQWVVVLWLVVFSWKSVKAGAGMIYLNRLRQGSTHHVDEHWHWRLRQLAQKIELYERVELVISELINVPMVTGFFRPMIIVPVGFLTSLPLNQVEAILLHELAHVKRIDYLVNLLQGFGETIFFFNPAILWVSSLIREEREHCCDDLAIGALVNKAFLVNALVSFQAYNVLHVPQAVAFAGKRNHLLERIKRIIYKDNKQLNAMEKLFVTGSIIAATVLSLALTPPKSESTPAETVYQVPKSVGKLKNEVPVTKAVDVTKHLRIVHEASPVDTLPKSKSHSVHIENGLKSMSLTHNGKSYQVVIDGEEIVYMKIDGKNIEKAEFKEHKGEIDQMLSELKESQERAEKDRRRADVERHKAEEFRAQADILRRQADEVRVQSDVIRRQSNADRNFNYNRNSDSMKESELNLKQNAEDLKEQELNLKRHAEDMKSHAEAMRQNATRMKFEAEKHREQAEKFRAEAEVHRQKAEVHRKEADVMRAEYEKLQEELIGALISAGVIGDKNNLSYKLSKDELIVNGKKQPDALHEKLRAKFLKTDQVEMVYNWSGRTGYTTTGIIYSR